MPCPLFSFVFLFRFSSWILGFLITPAPAPTTFLSAKVPIDTRQDSRPRVPLGGTAPQLKQDSWHRLVPPPVPPAVFQSLARSGCRSSSFRAEPSSTPATPDAQTPRRANPPAG